MEVFFQVILIYRKKILDILVVTLRNKGNISTIKTSKNSEKRELFLPNPLFLNLFLFS